jgi:hypothetical protein
VELRDDCISRNLTRTATSHDSTDGRKGRRVEKRNERKVRISQRIENKPEIGFYDTLRHNMYICIIASMESERKKLRMDDIIRERNREARICVKGDQKWVRMIGEEIIEYLCNILKNYQMSRSANVT